MEENSEPGETERSQPEKIPTRAGADPTEGESASTEGRKIRRAERSASAGRWAAVADLGRDHQRRRAGALEDWESIRRWCAVIPGDADNRSGRPSPQHPAEDKTQIKSNEAKAKRKHVQKSANMLEDCVFQLYKKSAKRNT